MLTNLNLWWGGLTKPQRLVVVIAATFIVVGIGFGIRWNFFRPPEVMTPFHPESTAASRMQIGFMARHSGCIQLSNHVALCREADGSEKVIVRKTVAKLADVSDGKDGTVSIPDKTLHLEGDINLGDYEIGGPVMAIHAAEGSVSVNTWTSPAVFRKEGGNGEIVLIFPSTQAQALGGGTTSTTAAAPTTATSTPTPSAQALAAVDQTVFTAVLKSEDGIAASWKEKLSEDDLRKRVETFEAYAAVQTKADTSYFAADGSAGGMYALTKDQLQEAVTGGTLAFPGSMDDLVQANRDHADTANKTAMAYWLFLESQTFPSSSAAATRFESFKEAWCVVGMKYGAAEMRKRIEEVTAEDPTSDPVLQEMQPWYEALGVYHASNPIK
jgi:hypothetical protein